MKLVLCSLIVYFLGGCLDKPHDYKSNNNVSPFSDTIPQNDWGEHWSPRAQIVNPDSIWNVVMNQTFSKDELENIKILNDNHFVVFCIIDSFGLVTESFINYCETKGPYKVKYEKLLDNIIKNVVFNLNDWNRSLIENGKTIYTDFLILNGNYYEVGEIGVLSDNTRKNLEEESRIRNDCE